MENIFCPVFFVKSYLGEKLIDHSAGDFGNKNIYIKKIYLYIYIYIHIYLSAEGAKNVSWPWLSPIRGWGSLTMASTIHC